MDARSDQESLVQVLEPEEPSPEEVWRHLIEKLQTRDPARRLGIARTLAQFGPPVVPLLVAELEAAPPEQQEAILSTLALLGRNARAAIPAVEKLCDDEHVGP